jgi:transposase
MRTDQASTGTEERVLAVSLELATAKWKVALHDGHREQPAVHTVAQPQAAARLQADSGVMRMQDEAGQVPADRRWSDVMSDARTFGHRLYAARR